MAATPINDLSLIPGRGFHGEFFSADASALSEANARITLYEDGTNTPITLAATERVYITDISVDQDAATAIITRIIDGAGTDDNVVDAGEKIWETRTTATLATHVRQFRKPYACKVGTYPKVKTSAAGNTTVLIGGYIA